MEYTLVLGIMCIVSACSIFIGYMAGHARAYSKGFKAGSYHEAAKWKLRIGSIYGKHNDGN